ncbi:MAG TPA: response regulator [Rhodocyclaceae bacterium]|nr:response regulator [Rhodocyclaceae bacterium]
MPVRKILVVDDSPTERHVMVEFLAGAGYAVLAEADGAAGVATARREQPDLVLMDVVMPVMNGFEATRTLTRDPATAHIPVFLCTAKRDDADRIWGMRQGARAYITKPVDISALLQRIAELP